MEMERALLARFKLGIEDRQHWPADDPGLNERARIDPDHRGAVEKRIEVVTFCLDGNRIRSAGRPDDGRTEV